MTTMAEIVSYVEQLTGHGLNADEGLRHGGTDRKIERLTLCWMATPEAIRSAGEAGHDLLICHESLYFPYNVVNRAEKPDGWEQWKINRQRRELLERYDLSCLRLHESVDEISIYDEFAEALGLGDPVFADGLRKVYEIPPCSLGDLLERVKVCFDMPSVRVALVTDLDQQVSRVGLPLVPRHNGAHLADGLGLVPCNCHNFG